MKWIFDIGNNFKPKKKLFWVQVFKVFVCLIIILFVLHLFVKDKVAFTDKGPTADIYDC